MLLCLDELFALLHFTPHLLHLILVGLPWYHVLVNLQLVLHLRGLEKQTQPLITSSPHVLVGTGATAATLAVQLLYVVSQFPPLLPDAVGELLPSVLT